MYISAKEALHVHMHILTASDNDNSNSDESSPEAGFYIYDLGSTHGTYLNKQKVRPRAYCRLRVGQMMRFGGSTRLFILEVHRYIDIHTIGHLFLRATNFAKRAKALFVEIVFED